MVQEDEVLDEVGARWWGESWNMCTIPCTAYTGLNTKCEMLLEVIRVKMSGEVVGNGREQCRSA
jgi:hypothetical protein